MEKRIIQCNTKAEIILTISEKTNGLEIVLVDYKNVPIAKYTFDVEKLKYVNNISYHSNNVRIQFDNISPSSESELCSVGD